MGKPTGFLEYAPERAQYRDPLQRLNDWQEIQQEAEPETIQRQASRCMDCSIPFCHSGIVLNGMVSGCPLHNLMPEFNDLLYRGLWQYAYKRLSKTNNFPEFTGRVCPAPCEGACTAGLATQPVVVKTIEYSIIEKAFAEGWVEPQPPAVRTGKKVAVIGSGPAGLACAAELNKHGHQVTVFERADRVGGLLMYGIPNMKLDKAIIDRRIQIMKAEGITFAVNTEVGTDYPATGILQEFDAAVLCLGAANPRDLMVEGRNVSGVYFAKEYLERTTKSLLDSNFEDNKYISAEGKDVIVIGGGDTGTDCVATALRQKCKSVHQLEIMPCLPTKRSADNPWPQFPRVYKVDYGQEEAFHTYGADPRHYSIMTKKLIGDQEGKLQEVHTVKVKWIKNNKGQMIPEELPGTEKVWSAQLVLLAMGFTGPESGLLDQLGIERDARSNIKAAMGTYQTNIAGVFAAGDARRGQSLVVSAIAEGREAAIACHKYLFNKWRLGSDGVLTPPEP